MIRILDQLNLRPQEKRLVVGAAAVLFVVLNLWLVWPHAGEWTLVKRQIARAEGTLKTYRTELARTNEYLAKLAKLEAQGPGVLTEDQASPLVLISTVQRQVSQSGLNPGPINPAPKAARSKGNEFFDQETLSVGINPTAPEQILDFLVALASGDLVIRVKELDLKPELPAQIRLTGTMKLVASFQKKSLKSLPSPKASPKPVSKS